MRRSSPAREGAREGRGGGGLDDDHDYDSFFA
jgi:hypothetical protein